MPQEGSLLRIERNIKTPQGLKQEAKDVFAPRREIKDIIRNLNNDGWRVKTSTTVSITDSGELQTKGSFSKYLTEREGFGKEQKKEDVTTITVGDKKIGVSKGVAEKIEKEILPKQEFQKRRSQQIIKEIIKTPAKKFEEGARENLVNELRKEPEPDISTREIIIQDYTAKIMEGTLRGEVVPSIIAGFSTRITPSDPFGLRSLGRVGVGIMKGQSAEVIKQDLDKITKEGLEWYGSQSLTEEGTLKRPIPYFVDTIPKTATGKQAIIMGTGVVAGAGFEAISPIIGKVAGGLSNVKIPSALLYTIPVGVEGVKVSKMVKEGKPPEEIFARVGSDVIYMGSFSAGFSEGKRVYDLVRTAGTKTIPTEQFFEKEIITGEKTFPTSGEHLSVVDRSKLHAEQFLKESPMRIPDGDVMGIHATNVNLFKDGKSFVVDPKYFKSELPMLYVAPSGSIYFAGISPKANVKLIGSNIDDMFGSHPSLYGLKPINPNVQINLAEKIPNVPNKPLGWKFKDPPTEGIIQVAGMKTETEGGFIAGTKFINPEMKYSVDIFGRRVPIITAEAVKGANIEISLPEINMNPSKMGSLSLYSDLGISKSVSLITPESSVAVSLANFEGRPTVSNKGMGSANTPNISIPSPTSPSIDITISGVSSNLDVGLPRSPTGISFTEYGPSFSPTSPPPSSTPPPDFPSPPPSSPPPPDFPSPPPSSPPPPDFPDLFGGTRKSRKSKQIKRWNFNIDLGYGPDIGSVLIGRMGNINPNKILSGVEIRPIPLPKFKGVSI